jgi:hypothetical protein
MEMNRHVPPPLDRGDRTDVIYMRVRDPDGAKLMTSPLDLGDDCVTVTARINDSSRSSRRVGDDVTVLLERTENESRDDHAE